MLGYSFKRLLRGRGLFLALFLSVILAATLFSGILQGADAVGVSLLNNVFSSTEVDIVSTARDKNLTRTRISEIHESISEVEGVKSVRHFIRWIADYNTSYTNGSLPITIIALPTDSPLLDDINRLGELDKGVVYIDSASRNSTDLPEGENVTLRVDTYQPFNPPGFGKETYSFKVSKHVTIKDKAFSLFFDRYNIFLRDTIIKTGEGGRRPPYQLMLMSEDTIRSILDPIYADMRRPTDDLNSVELIELNREALINQWDITGSRERIRDVLEAVNSIGADQSYIPQNYLGEVLKSVDSISRGMRTSTILVAAPVFFTAWYLGLTISDVSFSLRRREVGLLLIRGLTNRQVLYIFLLEGVIVGIFSGLLGVVSGAFILQIVTPDIGFLEMLSGISPFTAGASIAFSLALSALAVYSPAKRASEVKAVDALREYREEEEEIGPWQEPLLAVVLGGYKLTMLLLGLKVDQFQPTSGNFIINMLYRTWWGTDYLLSFIAPILFFWGLTKLFVQYTPWIQNILRGLIGKLSGEAAKFSSICGSRNLKRTASSTFMTALIIGYSVTVIGGIVSNDDFIERATRLSIGADASVWVFGEDSVNELAEDISSLEGVKSTAVEIWFNAESSLGSIPIRIINPKNWRKTAYIPEGWIDESILSKLNNTKKAALMERGAAEKMNLKDDGGFLIQLDHKTWTLEVIGLFGSEPGEAWSLQNPTLYIGTGFLQNLEDEQISQRRILAELEESMDYKGFKDKVYSLSRDVERVDLADRHVERTLNNVYLTAPSRMEELGAYFATLLASVGVVLIAYTLVLSRRKELSIMAIRGYSSGQMNAAILFENIGMNLFAITLGLAVGLISLRGEIDLFNTFVASGVKRRLIFPLPAKLDLLVIAMLILVSTAAPIILMIRRIQNNPIGRSER